MFTVGRREVQEKAEMKPERKRPVRWEGTPRRRVLEASARARLGQMLLTGG